MTHNEPHCPDFDSAWREAVRFSYQFAGHHRWSHKCVYWAMMRTDDLFQRQATCRKEFDVNYQECLETFEELPDPPAGQLEKKTEPAPVEVAESAIEKMRKTLRQGGAA